ncbi:hypothetical protein ElyMa_004607300 [Elysia marginata]|uniref:C-type lectin domain-containing protein n=1 Tax=Elysia marginata TaxID=1093978 RepID=A0AAV4HW69_9GAST|nr:hypothetical protein ElyMa_004607300 [Elysia marginata]
MLISVVLCLLFLATYGLGKPEPFYCPPRYRRQGLYCFTLTEKTPMVIRGYEHDQCSKYGGTTFSIKTWRDQRAAEGFLKDLKVDEKVWLRGFIDQLKFRKAANTFFWADDFHPKVKNFLDPDVVQKGVNNWRFLRCVVMDPRYDFKWLAEECYRTYHRALCSTSPSICGNTDCLRILEARINPNRGVRRKLKKQRIL